MSWLVFKKYQEQAMLKDIPVLEMSQHDYIELSNYCGDRFGFFQDLLKEMKEKNVLDFLCYF